jgi:hypothetical protein
MFAPDAVGAYKVLPHRKIASENLFIGQTLALCMQELMNEDELDNHPFRPRPISNGNFRLSHHCNIQGIDGPLDPTHLGLTTDNHGDNFLLNRVEVSNASGTVPMYVDVFFYLEERTPNTFFCTPEFLRKLPDVLQIQMERRSASVVVRVVLVFSPIYSPGRRDSSACNYHFSY